MKAATVNDLPFVQGLYNALNRSAKNSAFASVAVDDYVNQIDFSADYTVLTLDLVIPISNFARTKSISTIYYQDGLTTTLYDTRDMAIDATEMRQDGMKALDSIMQGYSLTRGYSSYDRIAARDYALAWTGSNVTSCYDDGPSCDILQNRTLWNNSEYPYIPSTKHNDYCDFVSQSIHAGGIPIDPGNWQRNKDSGNNWAWTSISGLKKYMKNYFDTSNFANAMQEIFC